MAPIEEAVLEELEPRAHLFKKAWAPLMALYSIAISLKRIADKMEKE